MVKGEGGHDKIKQVQSEKSQKKSGVIIDVLMKSDFLEFTRTKLNAGV